SDRGFSSGVEQCIWQHATATVCHVHNDYVVTSQPRANAVKLRPIEEIREHLWLVQAAIDKRFTMPHYFDRVRCRAGWPSLWRIDMLTSRYILGLSAWVLYAVNPQGCNGERGIRCRTRRRATSRRLLR